MADCHTLKVGDAVLPQAIHDMPERSDVFGRVIVIPLTIKLVADAEKDRAVRPLDKVTQLVNGCIKRTIREVIEVLSRVIHDVQANGEDGMGVIIHTLLPVDVARTPTDRRGQAVQQRYSPAFADVG